MKKYKLTTKFETFLGDLFTPVGIYLRTRDRFPKSMLLESSDYQSGKDSHSYICLNVIASFTFSNRVVTEVFPDGSKRTTIIQKKREVIEKLCEFTQCFETTKHPVPFVYNGLFGYMSYDAAEEFEDIHFTSSDTEASIPEIVYHVYQHIIVVDHFKNQLYLFEHTYENYQTTAIDDIKSLIFNRNIPMYAFATTEKEHSWMNDKEYEAIVEHGRSHCHRGDVFQVVLSRRFSRKFKGDDFNVYRALRNINPSPYLFYFNYEAYKIFGSSPEAQLVVSNGQAEIHPIAGTFKRTGNEDEDAILEEKLRTDEKENSEHVMLVDLARNDLSKVCENVVVEKFKEIQKYSHLIHITSKVVGKLKKGINPIELLVDSFPAGTLSGAPKYRAMQIIDEQEKIRRSFYGGTVGIIGFDGEINHAIIIRTFLSKNDTLYFQAGAGIVEKSNPKNEIEEVKNKLGALRKAIENAETMNKI